MCYACSRAEFGSADDVSQSESTALRAIAVHVRLRAVTCYHSGVGVKPAVRLRDLAEDYAALLRSAFGERLVAVVLHGPTARGETGSRFTIDLLVVVDPVARGGPFGRRE